MGFLGSSLTSALNPRELIDEGLEYLSRIADGVERIADALVQPEDHLDPRWPDTSPDEEDQS